MFKRKQEREREIQELKISADMEERELLQRSYHRWRTHFDWFLHDISAEDYDDAELCKRVGRAAEVADEALRVEEERWGRLPKL